MEHLSLLILLLPLATASAEPLLPPNWDAKQAGDHVLADLIQVTAHDAEIAIVNHRAYIFGKLE